MYWWINKNLINSDSSISLTSKDDEKYYL
jgi:hypothetical protein